MKKQESLILEIQRLALDKNIEIADLLRQALLVATKLSLNEFRKWVECELYGYKETPVPSYRKVRAELRLNNPFHGLIPFGFGDAELADIFLNLEIIQPIGSIINLVGEQKPDKTGPIASLTPEQEDYIIKIQGEFSLPPVRTVSRNQFVALVDAVRTKILEWSLDLESQGILGEGMSFSSAEKLKAATTTSIQIQNFQGVLGNIENGTLVQDLNMKVKKGDFNSLRDYLDKLNIEKDDIDELQVALDADSIPNSSKSFGTKVAAWIGKMIQKSATGTWQIGIEIAGSVLASAIAKYYGLLQ